jgi:AAA domain
MFFLAGPGSLQPTLHVTPPVGYDRIFGAEKVCAKVCAKRSPPHRNEVLMKAESPLAPDVALPVRPLRPTELAIVSPGHLQWLWHGYLARGKITVLISPPKTGKTTLLAHLLARFEQSGQLAGLVNGVAQNNVVSEEAASDWDARCRNLHIGSNSQFLCRPFQGARPTDAQWFALIAGLEALHRREGLDLVVIDALAALLPGYAETCGPKMLDCLLPLQSLANLGLAVLLLHHPAKGRRADGQTSRGSNALSGLADIVMEMSCYRRARSRDRRRRISAYSRYVETQRHLIVELNDDGTDYLVHTDADGTPLVQTWSEVEHVLTMATEKLSQRKILEQWPNEDDRPDRSTLSRWLKRATGQGLICCSGGGHCNDSFRYWLPGREPLLWPGDSASEEEKKAWRERRAAHYQKLREQLAAG